MNERYGLAACEDGNLGDAGLGWTAMDKFIPARESGLRGHFHFQCREFTTKIKTVCGSEIKQKKNLNTQFL